MGSAPLVMQCMKNSGLGKSSMEGIVSDSIHDVIHTLLSNDGKIVEMKNMLFLALTTTTWRMIAEFRPDAPFNIYPWLRFVPPNGFGFKQFIEANNRVLSYLKPIIDSHEKTLVDGNEADFIDHYLAKMNQHNDGGVPIFVNYIYWYVVKIFE
ncbi:hypothetical protein CHUAL_003526 [Chamberlinius hualienensis]